MLLLFCDTIYTHPFCIQVALFLLCMPIIAAPLEAIAVLGMSLEPLRILCEPHRRLGFVLAGVPVYYITRRSQEDMPRVFCECS